MANLFDILRNNPQDVGLLSNIYQQASQKIQAPDYKVETDNNVIPVQQMPTTNLVEPQMASTDQSPKEEPGFFSKLMTSLGNPEFQSALMQTTAAAEGNAPVFYQASNAYSDAVNRRKAEQAAKDKFVYVQQMAQQARQEALDKEQRGYQQQTNLALLKDYSIPSVAEYIKTGNSAVLVPNQTNQFKQQLDQARLNQVNAQTSKLNSEALNKMDDGTGGGSEPLKPYRDAQTGIVYVEGVNKGVPTGSYVQANAAQTKDFNEALQSKNINESPDVKLANSNMDMLRKASDEDIKAITGGLDATLSQNPTARNLLYSDRSNQLLNAVDQLGSQLGNKAIAAAKAAGASGINTEAELKRYTASMPKIINNGGVKAFRDSLAQVEKYNKDYIDDLVSRYGGQIPQSQPEQQTQTSTALPEGWKSHQ